VGIKDITSSGRAPLDNFRQTIALKSQGNAITSNESATYLLISSLLDHKKYDSDIKSDSIIKELKEDLANYIHDNFAQLNENQLGVLYATEEELEDIYKESQKGQGFTR